MFTKLPSKAEVDAQKEAINNNNLNEEIVKSLVPSGKRLRVKVKTKRGSFSLDTTNN